MELQTRYRLRNRVNGRIALLATLICACAQLGSSSAQGQSLGERLGDTKLERERNLAFKALDSDRFSEALNHFNRVLAQKPNDLEALYGRGWTYNGLKQWEKSIADYSQVIRQYPQQAEAYIGRAMARKGAGDYNGLVADMETATRLDPENQTYLDDARSTRLFSFVKWFYLALVLVIVGIGVVLVARLVRLMKGASAASAPDA